ncbi:MAG TPA: hypothetical protein VGC14_12655 [Rhizobium sp.]
MLIGYSTARNKGNCENRINIRRDELESRVLNALRNRIPEPAIFAEFYYAYTQESNRPCIEAAAVSVLGKRRLRRLVVRKAGR